MRVAFVLIVAGCLCWAGAYLFVLPRAVHELDAAGVAFDPADVWTRLPALARHSPAAALIQGLALAGALLFAAGFVWLVAGLIAGLRKNGTAHAAVDAGSAR